MDDYEMRDIANRRRNPIVKGVFELGGPNRRSDTISGLFSLSLKNDGQVLADQVYMEFAVPVAVMDDINRFPGQDQSRQEIKGVSYRIFKYHLPHPIFPNVTDTVLDGNALYLSWKVNGPWFRDNWDTTIICTVYADNAEPQVTQKKLTELLPLDFQTAFPINFKGRAAQ
jgi:hypothetical protein